jgi:hypothetical protein
MIPALFCVFGGEGFAASRAWELQGQGKDGVHVLLRQVQLLGDWQALPPCSGHCSLTTLQMGLLLEEAENGNHCWVVSALMPVQAAR